MGCGGLSSVYLSTLSLGGATRIEYRPLELESALFVVTCGVISAVVVVVAVADSAVSWHFRWPGGLWRPLLGLPEHAEPRWCYEFRVAAVGAGICPPLSTNFCSNEGSAASMFEGRGSGERLALSGSEGALIERLQEDDETATGR